jgi:glycosyltransferase involved in cell wall biosynthesis
MHKILFVSSSRYPTEKAYGVTIGRSAEAARYLGDEVVIISPTYSGDDSFGNNVVAISNLYSIAAKLFYHMTFRSFNILYFYLGRLVVYKKTKKIMFFEKFNFLWLRDPIIAYKVGKTFDVPVLLEIHHIPKKLDLHYCKKISDVKNIIIATLTDFHKEELQKKGISGEIHVIPMGYSKDFQVKAFSWPKGGASKIRICYLGKSQSNGNDNLIENMVRSLIFLLREGSKFELSLIGLERDFIDRVLMSDREMLKAYESKKIVIMPHVSHLLVPDILKSMDIGILPYPNTHYNNSRFPIKALEYAASATAIVSSGTESHRNILKEDFVSFYDQGDPDSLVSTILGVVNNPTRTLEKLISAQKWVEKLTYTARVMSAKNACKIITK